VAASAPIERSRSPAAPNGGSFSGGAGALAEHWDGEFGFGARIAVGYQRRAWSFGLAFGWLTTPPGDEEFRANELHGVLFGAAEDRRTGLRGTLGPGVSFLFVEPNPELILRSATTLPLVFLDAWLSRPIRFGHASVVPAAGLRMFPKVREVLVDTTRRLALPPLCPALFLGFGYET
jgi:hypothetical protein